ncbi:MAG: hypothetical protein JXA35_02845 [Deltaproteobacteria bacterium]|nr:hypothetical protein [Deltaproteobacteria bacterium]
MIKRVILFTILISILWTVNSMAVTIIAIKSRDLPQYDQAISGFRSGFQVQELNLTVIHSLSDKEQISSTIEANCPDLILCLGTEALNYSISIKNIPKVFCLVANPETYISHGVTDVYGVAISLPSLDQFRIIAGELPEFKRIGVIYNAEFNREYIEDARKNASKLALELVAYSVSSIKDIPSALHFLKDKIDVLWSVFDSTVYGPETARYILLFSLRKEIPFIGFSPEFAKAGALMALYGDYKDMGSQTALLAMDILANKRMHNSILEPRLVRIAVNSKVAKAMGISFSPAFLKKIDQDF